MGPDYIKLVIAVLGFLKGIGSWPLGLIFLVVIIGPWLLAVLLAWGQAKRFKAVEDMYSNNAKLVESYEKLATALNDVVITNTAAMTSVCDAIDRMERNRR
jgi:hypothetical protein